MFLGCLLLATTSGLSSTAPGSTAPPRPLLGQRVNNATLLKTRFCQLYGCKIGSTSITGTGSGNAVELNYRGTDVLLNNGMFLQLEREPNTRLVSVDLKSLISPSRATDWSELANVSAEFFALMLHRPVSARTPEIQECIAMFKSPDRMGDLRGFWEKQGTKTGACIFDHYNTATGTKTYFGFIAQMP